MTSFPVFERLRVADYGLYPGPPDSSGLTAEFDEGLTLVLGANGLGKTTLVTLLFRLCTGPFDVGGLATSTGQLGNRNLEARRMSPQARRLFRARVSDAAESATATLRMRIGETMFEVTRNLRDLGLEELSVDGAKIDPTELQYQDAVMNSARVRSFGDWILLLRHFTFYFEDRRSLVWDPSAQSQILRVLFVAEQGSNEWVERQRAILETDSRMRNLQNALTKEERSYSETELAVEGASEVRDRLRVMEGLQAADEANLDDRNDEILAAETARQEARLRALRAEQARESAYRDLERRELFSLSAAFPSNDESLQYIYGKLFATGTCLVCGKEALDAAELAADRVKNHDCLVCGSTLADHKVRSPSRATLDEAAARLEQARVQLETAESVRNAAEEEFAGVIREARELQVVVARRAEQIDSLVARLPPEEAEVLNRRSELTALRSSVEIMKDELAVSRNEFRAFIDRVNRRIARSRGAVQEAFSHFAKGFLLEECTLAWAPKPAKVGESGEQITFPGYELDMSGADFATVVRRTGPDQVSESQREFIDLAFRMALMRVAGEGGVGSLVIDAPESSLDAVFVTRAADVLSRFAEAGGGNRLLITSNLVEGDLIPELIRRAGIASPRSSRVVDLFNIATPTAATRELAAEYDQVKLDLFAAAS